MKLYKHYSPDGTPTRTTPRRKGGRGTPRGGTPKRTPQRTPGSDRVTRQKGRRTPKKVNNKNAENEPHHSQVSVKVAYCRYGGIYRYGSVHLGAGILKAKHEHVMSKPFICIVCM